MSIAVNVGSNLVINSFRLETFRFQDEEDYEYDI